MRASINLFYHWKVHNLKEEAMLTSDMQAKSTFANTPLWLSTTPYEAQNLVLKRAVKG